MFLNYKILIFYAFILLCLLAVLFTTPFLRYPYDTIHHLIVIDELYDMMVPSMAGIGIWENDICIMIPNGYNAPPEVPNGRKIWHYLWAKIFYVLHIDSTQIFLRAKIIHVVQIFVSLFSVYYFSKVVIRNIFKNIQGTVLRWLSLWSVIIWLTIFATSSAYYHQVWIMWYSINYQITLPLFWYILGLTLVLLLEETSWKVKLLVVIQILFISRFILQAHSMEFMYYFMHISIFALVFIDKIYIFFKRYYYILIPIMLGIGYFIKNYQPEKSKIFDYLSAERLPLLYEKIMHEGQILINGANRASVSMNELIYFIGFISLLFLIHFMWDKYNNKSFPMNTRMLLFIGITSLFISIPLFQFSGGLFAIITKTMVVNRLYYSSSLFIVLPIVVYYVYTVYNLRVGTMHLMLFVTLIFVYIFSKHSDVMNHNYYKNIQSIKNSFYERRVGFHLSTKQIDMIGQQIKQYEIENLTQKKIRYYTRADIAFVIKYIYHKNVYWKGRHANPNYIKAYNYYKNNKDYYHILFEIPKDFPNYKPYM